MITMQSYRIFHTVILIVCVFGLTQATEVEIECVPLRDCPELLKLLNETPVSSKAIRILKTSHCGFVENHPKVWCTRITSPCRTPNGRQGTCVPVKKCEPFLQILRDPNGLSQEVKGYLRKFECEDEDANDRSFSVCCSTDKEPLVTKQPAVNRPNTLPRPTEGECGRQVINKVIGGKVTEMDEFPWTARLQYQQDTEILIACGGSLISNKYVVTAAHCVDRSAVRRVGELINVILGEFDTRTERDCVNALRLENCADPPVSVPVQGISIHPQWLSKPAASINSDIALLRLVRTVIFTDYIQPICLPSSTLTIREKERLIVTGWGQTETSIESFVKLKTDIPLVNRDFCVQKYKNEKSLTVGDGLICAGGEEGKDSCSGDSGGPLMLPVDRNGAGVWFLVGIVSFGPNQPCGVKDYPALYTYLPRYIDWIYKTIQP